MVLQKRLYYGFNGFEVPAMPRASRSVRRRRLFEKKVEDSRMRAFDLLATVAGELLEEKGSSAAPSNVSAQISESVIRKDSIKQEQQDGPHSFKPEPCDQGSCDESASVFVLSSQRHGHDFSFKEYLHSKEDSTFGLASVITKSERPANTTCARDFGESSKEYENFPCMICGKRHVERGSPGCAESHDGKVNDEIDRQMEVEQPRAGSVIDGAVVDMFHLKDPMEIDTKPPALVSSDSSVEVPLHGIRNHCSSFTRCQDDVKVVSRDDDENSSVSTRLPTLKSYRLSRLGDRRIRKLLASKHWKATPAMLKKDGVFSNTESDIKPVFRSRKICYTHQRSQRCSFKRRKLFGRSLISISDRGINGEAVSSSPDKKVISEATGLGGTMHQASRAPVTSQKSSLESRDSHVKLRIKSFRVPELFIEIPETATVGSLKRTVMEAVTAVLGSGLRVGVLLHGKKVRDDNRTLLQTGISHDDKLDSLGFTLEPTTVHPPPPQCFEDCHSLLPCDSTEPLTRYPPVPSLEPGLPETSPDLPLADSGNSTEDSYESVPSPPDMSTEKTTPDSKALVAVPDMSVEAIAVPGIGGDCCGKSRRSELVQRRIRRPFSVSEVEALVQAVEKLGTGRWHDVKLRAFDNAKHRTYVDLKDKWKTMVHTARISPQQRRGVDYTTAVPHGQSLPCDWQGREFYYECGQESGASVEVGDPRADSDHCVISITSTESTDDLKSSSVEAVLLLQGKINSNDDDDTVNISVLVPRRVIGCLIGKSGSIVNEIRQRTKANIRISKGKKPVCANADEELVEVIGEVDRVREALVQIVLRLRDDVLKERDGPHGALSSDSLFSGGPRTNSNADSLYSGSSRNAPVADSLYSSALRSAPSDSLYSGGIALPSALSSIPPITPLSYDLRIESGSSLGRLSVGSLYGYGSLQVGR